MPERRVHVPIRVHFPSDMRFRDSPPVDHDRVRLHAGPPGPFRQLRRPTRPRARKSSSNRRRPPAPSNHAQSVHLHRKPRCIALRGRSKTLFLYTVLHGATSRKASARSGMKSRAQAHPLFGILASDARCGAHADTGAPRPPRPHTPQSRSRVDLLPALPNSGWTWRHGISRRYPKVRIAVPLDCPHARPRRARLG